MSLTSDGETGMVMPVAPMGGYQGGSGFGGFGDGNGWWILLLFILLGFGGNGWGNNGGNGGGFYPYAMGTDASVQRGFDQSAIMGGINGINGAVSNGFSNVQQSLCNGFAGVNATVNSGFANAETAANARQMANIQTAFAGQTAMANGFNQLASQFADCCCENRLASADLKYTIATENCADRTALSDGIRDVLANQNAGIQRILDQMCNDKIDAKNERIADLERQLTMANLAASQNAQTAAILANNESQTTALEQYLAPVPRPAYIVQNPNCCAQTGCGCGCGSF